MLETWVLGVSSQREERREWSVGGNARVLRQYFLASHSKCPLFAEMDYVDYKRFIRNAFSNKAYMPTYAAFGAGAVIALIYITDWETVGRHIPLFKYHFEALPTADSKDHPPSK